MFQDLNLQNNIETAFHNYQNRVYINFGSQNFTYSFIKEKALCIHNCLSNKGIMEGDVIGILTNNRFFTIVSILSILKSRCKFVNLNPELPKVRLNEIIQLSNIGVVLTEKNIDTEIRDSSILKIHIADAISQNSDFSNISSLKYNIEDEIYIYFSSGSSGVPKGIVGKNKSITHFMKWEIQEFKIDNTYNTSQIIHPDFDAFLRDIFVPFFAGGKLCIPPSNFMKWNLEDILNWFSQRQIKLIHCVPSFFKLINVKWNKGLLKSLSYILLSGEKIHTSVLKRWYENNGCNIQLVNLYGCTETTLIKTFYRISKNDLEKQNIPVGMPINNTQIFVLNSNLGVCDKGEIGEIYIRSPYITHGYLNNEKLTKEKFRENPFNPSPTDLFYKTGDLGRILNDGNLELKGRVDGQIKIRGIRVDVEDIESTLMKIDEIETCIVKYFVDEDNDCLCCFYKLKSNTTDINVAIAASNLLPGYLLPNEYIKIKEFQLTTTGKIDRKKILKPTFTDNDFCKPENNIEYKLRSIWSQILNISADAISTEQNFFNLGGNSINVITLSYKINEVFSVKIPIKELFVYQKIRQLSQYIQQQKACKREKLVRSEKKEYYKLSRAQKRIYFINEFDKNSIVYNMPKLFKLERNIELNEIENIFNKIIKKHEILRTSFILKDNSVYQKVQENVVFKIKQLSQVRDEKEVLLQNLVKPFNLEKAPLIRVVSFDLDSDKYLLVDTHHIIFDGESIVILLNDFNRLLQGKSLNKLDFQYKDIVEWNSHKSFNCNIKIDEWLNENIKDISNIELPSDFVRPAIKSFEGNKLSFSLSSEKTNTIRNFARELNVTTNQVLLAVFNLFIYKLTGQNQIIIGFPTSARNLTEFNHIIGMLVNTHIIRTEINKDMVCEDFIKYQSQIVANNIENEYYELESFIDRYTIERDISRNPIFDIVYNFQKIDSEASSNQMFVSEFENIQRNVSKFDFVAHITEFKSELGIVFEYSTAIFKQSTIERYIKFFQCLLNNVLISRNKKIAEIELITEIEKEQIYNDLNNTSHPLNASNNICELIEQSVSRYPNRIAFNYKDEFITYYFLKEQSDKIAAFLVEIGVLKGSLVVILVDKNIDLILFLLGILKAGAVFIPIDYSTPTERIRNIINRQNIKFAIIDKAFYDNKKSLLTSNLSVEKLVCTNFIMDVPDDPQGLFEASNIYNYSLINVGLTEYKINIYPNDLAYIIYTSGSSGEPKGVMICHHTVVNLINWANTKYSITPDYKLLYINSIGFDLSIYDIFGILSGGASFEILEREKTKDANAIVTEIEKKGINFWDSAPAAAQQLVYEYENNNLFNPINSLKLMFLSGDWIPVNLPNSLWRMFPNLNLIALGGATEATIWSNYFEVKEPVNKLWKSIPYGKPIQNAKYFILDEDLNICPVGIPGDLFIGGNCLSIGYVNNINETSYRYIPDPKNPNEIIYRTGDRARWYEDGNIEFLGRKDNQVKIRGYRIELEEIKNKIKSYNLIKDSLIVLQGENLNDYKIVSYFVSNARENEQELKSYLSKYLPEYMIPSFFIQIDEIPLNANKKINYKALPAPQLVNQNESDSKSENSYRLANIWSEILKISVKQIGSNSNFFEIGGHSLSATILAAKVKKEFDVQIKITDIFQNSTLSKLEKVISSQTKTNKFIIPKAEYKEYYSLSPQQLSIYYQQKVFNDTTYNIPIILEIKGKINNQALKSAFNQLLIRHESLRTNFKIYDSVPVQIINPSPNFKLQEGAFHSSLINEKITSLIKPFDLENDLLFRAGIFNVENEKSILFMDLHHIITDGFSTTILIKDLLALYNKKPIIENRIQYKDYSTWFNKRNIKNQEDFWLNELKSITPNYFNKLVGKEDREGDIKYFELDEILSERIRSYCKHAGLTHFMFLFTILKLVLAKLNNQPEFIIGVPVSGRRYDELEKVNGMFVNTLPIYCTYNKDEELYRLLFDTKEQFLNSLENQDYPLNHIQLKICNSLNISSCPLFNTIFMVENNLHETQELNSFSIKPVGVRSNKTKFDLSVIAYETKQITFKYEFNKLKYSQPFINRCNETFVNFIQQFFLDNFIKIKDLKIPTKLKEINVSLPGFDIEF